MTENGAHFPATMDSVGCLEGFGAIPKPRVASSSLAGGTILVTWRPALEFIAFSLDILKYRLDRGCGFDLVASV